MLIGRGIGDKCDFGGRFVLSFGEVMEVTSVRIEKYEGSQKRLKGFAEVVIDEALVLKDVRIIDVEDRYIVCMPDRFKVEPCGACGVRVPVCYQFCGACGKPRHTVVKGRGAYVDVAHPITSAFRDVLTRAVVDAYLALQ